MDSYGEFVSHILGLMESIGVLQPMGYFVLFVLALAGFRAVVNMFRGG